MITPEDGRLVWPEGARMDPIQLLVRLYRWLTNYDQRKEKQIAEWEAKEAREAVKSDSTEEKGD